MKGVSVGDLPRAGSARQRAANYLQRAAKLRDMAEAETVSEIRSLLLQAAEQYQKLADRLYGA